MIKENILNASKVYLVDYKKYESTPTPPRREVSGYDSYKYIVQDLPTEIESYSHKRSTKYKYQGSINTGNMAKVPWICIFDKDITVSATKGYYIVFLFRADMKGGYLSLNQGFTQYKEKFGEPKGRKKAIDKAKFYQKILKSKFEINTTEIKLHSSTSLGKGYEAGNICSKYFPFEAFPNDDSFMVEIEKFKDLYQFIKEDIIDRSVNTDGTEEEFQFEIQEGKEEHPSPGGVPIQGKGGGKSHQSWKRKRNRAFTALKDAKFKCEVKESHETFKSSKTEKPYMEAHHLIPMEKQGDFEYSIDISENIICLCPNCHRAFHNSIDKIKSELVTTFFQSRKDALHERKIDLTENKLLEYYKTTPNNT